MIHVKRGSNVFVKVEMFLNSNTTVADMIELGRALAESGIPANTKIRRHNDGGSTLIVASHNVERPHPDDEER